MKTITGAILGQALADHPLRGATVWGVRVCNYINDKGVRYYSFATHPHGWTFGRLPAGMTLTLAVECYVQSIQTWKEVVLFRHIQVGSCATILEGVHALETEQYKLPENNSTYDRLKSKGAILPENYGQPAAASITNHSEHCDCPAI